MIKLGTIEWWVRPGCIFRRNKETMKLDELSTLASITRALETLGGVRRTNSGATSGELVLIHRNRIFLPNGRTHDELLNVGSGGAT